MDPRLTPTEFINTVCAQVRFKPDRPGIARELSAHLEDRAEMLMAHGFDEDTARSRAVAAMGDPEEIGRELDKEHSPFWGWASIWTDILRYIAIFLTTLVLFLLLTESGLSQVFYQSGQTGFSYVDDTVIQTVPLWEWHATEHFFLCFTKAEVVQYSGDNPYISDSPRVMLFYYQWHRNPFLHTEQYISCRAVWDESGTLYEGNHLPEDARPKILRYEFASPDGSSFIVEVPLKWEGVE